MQNISKETNFDVKTNKSYNLKSERSRLHRFILGTVDSCLLLNVNVIMTDIQLCTISLKNNRQSYFTSIFYLRIRLVNMYSLHEFGNFGRLTSWRKYPKCVN